MINGAQAVLDKARAERDEALKTDPFTNYLITVVGRDYDSYVETVTKAMPITLEGLKKLADNHDWCTSFEQWLAKAAEKGLLHEDDTQRTEVKRRLTGWDVESIPHKYGAQHNGGEVWEATIQVPNYMRPAMYGTSDLIHYSGGEEYTTFLRIHPKPEQQTETTDTDTDG